MATTDDRQRRGAADLLSQIPTDGQRAAPLPDGSQSNPLNTELGRNAMNTLSALPGVSGVASRAGAGAARGAAGALSTERVIPASWEVVQEGGALARAADGGGTLSRAASTAMQQQSALTGNAAQLLSAPPSRALAPRVAGEVGEAAPQFARRPAGPPPWADVVEPAALTAQQASPAASALSSLGGSNLGRALGTGAALGSAVIAGSTLDPNGGGDASPLGSAQAAQPAGAAAAASPAAQALAAPPAASRNNVTRDGNSYTGPANISGDITVNSEAPRGSVMSLPAGAVPAEFSGGSAALRALGGMPAGGLGGISEQNMSAADALAARSQLESMARLRASGQIASPEPGPSMSLSGSTLGFRRAPGIVASELGAQRAFDRNMGRDPASLQRGAALTKTAMEQQGETQRQLISSGATLQAAGLKAAAGRGAPPGYRFTSSGSLEAIPGGPADLKNSKEAQQQTKDSSDVISLATQADLLLDNATASLAGAGTDAALRAVGLSTPGGDAAAQLKVLQGMLVSKMPKMSGPQSDKDVQLYREMAGQIGDATLPASTRRAALDQIYALNAKYASPESLASAAGSPLAQRYQAAQQQAAQPKAAAAPAGPAARIVIRTGVIDGRRVAQYSDGSVEYAN